MRRQPIVCRWIYEHTFPESVTDLRCFFVFTVVQVVDATPRHNPGIYNGSKAALTMATDVWRRELQPLGVRTITLVTTSVKTQAFEHTVMPKVPETSYYSVIRDYVYGLADGRLQDGGQDPLTYGLGVVKAVDNGTVGEIWLGKDATMNYWSWKLLPQPVFVSFGDTRAPWFLSLAYQDANERIELYPGWDFQGFWGACQGGGSDEDEEIIEFLPTKIKF